MQYKIIKKEENNLIGENKLKLLKTEFEITSASVDNLKYSTEDIYFKDHNNDTVIISPSNISNYIDKLKIKLSNRYTKINTLYNNIKINGTFTLKQAQSAFENLDI